MVRDGWGAGAVAVRRLPRGERGSVSAETAVVLPVLLVVLAMAVWVLAAVGAQLRCTDAAGVAARLVARGEPPEQVVAAARDIAPAGASVELRVGGGDRRGPGARLGARLRRRAEPAAGPRRGRPRRVRPRGPGGCGARRCTRGAGRAVSRCRLTESRPRRTVNGCERGRTCRSAGARPDDTGSGSVLLLALTAVVVLLAGMLVALGTVATTRHRALAAADAAALTAASRVVLGQPAACAAARAVTEAAGGVLTGCHLDGPVAEVWVAVHPDGPLAGYGPARGRARAGPDR